ncbi:hypothetical protein LZ554_006131 [Drepanopeziza brunnea f. sp. 'monogermtubi']|nr:hypothetical protein LZ554_006131 [Drepanopeziza brunnea f. sp. 'monogermtubi']
MGAIQSGYMFSALYPPGLSRSASLQRSESVFVLDNFYNHLESILSFLYHNYNYNYTLPKVYLAAFSPGNRT